MEQKNSKSDEMLKNQERNEKAEKLQSFLKNQTIKIKKIHRKNKDNSKIENGEKALKYIKYDPNIIKNIDTTKQG